MSTLPTVTVAPVEPVTDETVTSGIDMQVASEDMGVISKDMPTVMPSDMPTDEDYLAALGPCGK
jgi:hypothetical protein